MDKKNRTFLTLLSGVLVTGLLLSIGLPLPAGTAQWLQPDRLAAVETTSLSGVFIGQVELDYALPGTYEDPLLPPEPDGEPLPELGSIDFGLQLTQDGTAVEGYVDLAHTLVFTTEHVTVSAAFGPMVTGSVDGEDILLVSERVELVSGGQPLMRQFRLTGGLDPENDQQFVGEYRETVWGYGPQPLTIVGRFSLQWTAPVMTDFIFMPLINQ